MHANDLSGFDSILSQASLSADEFWKLDLAQMTELNVSLFYRRAKKLNQFDQAKFLIRELQECLLTSSNITFARGEHLTVLMHRVPDPIFTIDDLVDGLSQMTEVRQNAVLFALETGMTPERVIDIGWDDQVQLPTTSCIKMILKQQTAARHVKLKYVFWEWCGDVALPLVSLKADAEMAFGKSWPAIVATYNDMVFIEPKADAAEVRLLLDELKAIGG